MYGSGVSYSRYRPAYDNNERRRDASWSYTSPWTSTTATSKHLNTSTAGVRRPTVLDEYPMATSSSSTSTSRRPRYSRSSTTTSVAQLLSDSCSSLLQKLTTRVRGPSATVERQLQHASLSTHPNPLTTSKSSTIVPNLGATRSRLEDKYSSVLDRIYRRRDPEKTIEPSVGRTLQKSSTTANVLLAEKAYPYVSSNNNNNVVYRDKTPYRNETHASLYKRQFPEPQYTYLDKDSAYRVRHRSNHSELRPRRSSKPSRTGKSEVNDRKPTTTNLKLCPVEIKLHDDHVQQHCSKKNLSPIITATTTLDDEVTPTPDCVSEREAKRKEIQNLIMKYSALDEAYNKVTGDDRDGACNSSIASTSSAVMATPCNSIAAAISQKYYPNLVSAVAVSRVVLL